MPLRNRCNLFLRKQRAATIPLRDSTHGLDGRWRQHQREQIIGRQRSHALPQRGKYCVGRCRQQFPCIRGPKRRTGNGVSAMASVGKRRKKRGLESPAPSPPPPTLPTHSPPPRPSSESQGVRSNSVMMLTMVPTTIRGCRMRSRSQIWCRSKTSVQRLLDPWGSGQELVGAIDGPARRWCRAGLLRIGR